MRLERLSHSPILSPVDGHGWEAGAVFNCAAISHNELVHLIYRATDITSNGQQGEYINSLGYAASSDGLSFSRLDRPILCNDVEQELRGPEDPRIVEIDGIFYMTYTGYGGRFPGDYRISLASSPNLISWQRHGVLLDEPNKDAALFPEKIGGRYVMLHRREPDIWLAFSDDLLHWDNHRSIMQPIPESYWESTKVGAAGPPVRTDDGWLLIYHGVGGEGDSRRYSLGIALLDLQDPTQVLARQSDPILEPEMDWEIDGYVPNVVFSCGQAIVGQDIYVYYGGADTAIGVASMSLQDVTFG
jgi:predicted GH43/DUF377 family glycosyl hydrolase